MNEGKQILNLYMKLKFMLDHSDPSEPHDADGEGTYLQNFSNSNIC